MSAKDTCIKAGSYCPVCRGISGADCWHDAHEFNSGSRYLGDLIKAKERISALEAVIASHKQEPTK